jgi:hypothetical protein
MIHQTKVKLAEDVLIAYKKELAALEKGDPLPVPEWLQARDDDDDDDDVEDSHPQEEEEEEVVDEEVVDEEEDDEDGDEVDEHLEDDDGSQAHSFADSDDSDDESYLPGDDDEEEDDIDDVIDLVVEDDDVLAGYVAPQNIFTRLYYEVRENWAIVRTDWMSFWQRMSGLFFAEAPAVMEEKEFIINDDVVILS